MLVLAAPSVVAADRLAGSIANRDAARWYENGSPALFVDLRTAGERAQAASPGRLGAPAPRALAGRRVAGEVAAVADPGRTVVLCAEGVSARGCRGAARKRF
jgi:hypothetical protein